MLDDVAVGPSIARGVMHRVKVVQARSDGDVS